MTSREIKRLVTAYLLPSLPGYRVRGSLLYAEPVEDLLRGFLFETSAFDRTALHVTAFVQPLYVPAQYLVLTFGERLGGGAKRWRPVGEQEEEVMRDLLLEIKKTGLPFLNRIKTPADLARQASMEARRAPDNPVILEVEAYSLVLVGRDHDARALLERIEQLARDLLQANPLAGWLEVVGARAKLLRETLARDHAEAVAFLDQWRVETLTALGLGPNRQTKR